MKPSYIIERWPHGWVICKPSLATGIPMDALSECATLFPRGAVMDAGIVHHLRFSGKQPDAVMCVATGKDSALWRAEITASLKDSSPYEQWWQGVDVGTSSAAMFAALCEDGRLAAFVGEFGRGSTPKDADDFSRCQRLVSRFPEWRDQLAKVSETYPNTSWPMIVENWDRIVADPTVLQQITK